MLASPSWCAVAPATASMPSTPRIAMSSVTCSSTPVASGPVSSYDCGLATPPVTTILMCCRTASSVAMLSALVTTVTAGGRGRRGQVGPDGQRPGHLGRGGAAVEAGDLTGPDQSGGGGPDPMLLRRVPLGLVPQRQIVGHPLRDRTAADPGQHLLAGQLVEVAPDRSPPRRRAPWRPAPPAAGRRRRAVRAAHSSGGTGSPGPPRRSGGRAEHAEQPRTSPATASRPAAQYLLGSTSALVARPAARGPPR